MKECYQLIDGPHQKFWTIEVIGRHYLVTFGRIGTAGQTQVKAFATETMARVQAASIARTKTRKGYVKVGHVHPGAPPDVVRSLGGSPAEETVPAEEAAPAEETTYRRIRRDL